MTDVTQMSSAQAGAGRTLAQLGWQSILRRPTQGGAWLGRRIGCARARGLAARSFHPRRRLRPFLHACRGDQRPAAEPEEHARARQRRPRSQARRRARRHEDRRYRPRAQTRSVCRSPIRAISTPRRSPAPFRPARTAPASGLAACRPRRSACGSFSPTDRS